ncbi:MAG TPA: HD domain-containing protein [Spirochaetota bacterium]|nr:HD domain-containing protein [Spirochaetota bacterium]HOS38395.1 HD domain-containing protein [Spirochaetota bacterium]HPU87782.1 HD domain-containing protein [Spirochaetota bacterium]
MNTADGQDKGTRTNRIDLRFMKAGTINSFDLKDEYGTVVIEAYTALDQALINHLLGKGVQHLYYTEPEKHDAAKSAGGIDLATNAVSETLQRESIDQARDILEYVRESFNVDPGRTINTAMLAKSRGVVEKILDGYEKNKNAAFSPVAKLKSMDEYTLVHSSNVSTLAAILGTRLELSKDIRIGMGVGGLFHDIGKTSLSDAIVLKAGKLSDEEFDRMKEHPHVGYKFVEGNPSMHDIEKRIILLHHESPDANGYPFGMDLEHYQKNVPREIRLLTICDVYSALTTERPYGRPYAPREALRILLNSIYAPYKKKYRFLPNDLRDFIRSMGFILNNGEFFFDRGDVVRLNSGEIGVIEGMNRLYPLNPVIRVIADRESRKLKRPIVVDMLKEYNSYIAHLFDKGAGAVAPSA